MQPRTKPQQNIESDVAILSPNSTCAFLGVCRTKLEEMARTDPEFPKAVLIGVMRSSGRPSRIGWLKSELEDYARKLAKTRIHYIDGRAQIVRDGEPAMS